MCDKTQTSCAGIQDDSPDNELRVVESTASEGDSRSDILDPFRNLAKRWREAEAEHKRIWDQADPVDRQNGSYRIIWSRYVDYGRRAAELELRIRVTERMFGNGS